MGWLHYGNTSLCEKCFETLHYSRLFPVSYTLVYMDWELWLLLEMVM